VGHFTERFSGVRGPNFTKLGGSMAIISQSSDMFLRFQKRAAQIWLMLKTTPNFALFYPPCQNYGRGGRSLDQLWKLYVRSNLRNTFDGYPLLGCWARCIDKKRKQEQK